MFKFGIIAASAGSGGYTPANIADVAFWLNHNVSTPTNVPRPFSSRPTPPNSIFKVQSIPNSYVVGESAYMVATNTLLSSNFGTATFPSKEYGKSITSASNAIAMGRDNGGDFQNVINILKAYNTPPSSGMTTNVINTQGPITLLFSAFFKRLSSFDNGTQTMLALSDTDQSSGDSGSGVWPSNRLGDGAGWIQQKTNSTSVDPDNRAPTISIYRGGTPMYIDNLPLGIRFGSEGLIPPLRLERPYLRPEFLAVVMNGANSKVYYMNTDTNYADSTDIGNHNVRTVAVGNNVSGQDNYLGSSQTGEMQWDLNEFVLVNNEMSTIELDEWFEYAAEQFDPLPPVHAHVKLELRPADGYNVSGYIATGSNNFGSGQTPSPPPNNSGNPTGSWTDVAPRPDFMQPIGAFKQATFGNGALDASGNIPALGGLRFYFTAANDNWKYIWTHIAITNVTKGKFIGYGTYNDGFQSGNPSSWPNYSSFSIDNSKWNLDTNLYAPDFSDVLGITFISDPDYKEVTDNPPVFPLAGKITSFTYTGNIKIINGGSNDDPSMANSRSSSNPDGGVTSAIQYLSAKGVNGGFANFKITAASYNATNRWWEVTSIQMVEAGSRFEVGEKLYVGASTSGIPKGFITVTAVTADSTVPVGAVLAYSGGVPFAYYTSVSSPDTSPVGKSIDAIVVSSATGSGLEGVITAATQSAAGSQLWTVTAMETAFFGTGFVVDDTFTWGQSGVVATVTSIA